MKYLLLNSKILTFVLFLFLLCPSCNNEEIFVIEQSAIIDEDSEDPENTEATEEETPNSEDEVLLVETVDDTVVTTENVPVNIEAYLNDTNLPENLTISNTNPSNGTLDINDNDTPDVFTDDIIVYTPNIDFFGTDSFEYTVCDELDGTNCDSAMVNITIEENTTDFEDEFSTELKAFPTAYGAGAFASGGRGGNVYHVTNLNDSGPGTYRDALSQPRPATIVFDVSGVIKLTSWLQIWGNDLTIAGQTAPEGGITITWDASQKYRIRTADNLIMRYMRIRPLESGNDAFEVWSDSDESKDIILDHVSVSYGGDEALTVRGRDSHNITFQRCLVAESKTGSLFGDSDINNSDNSYDNSLHNCLYFNVSHRTPNAASNGRIDIINNVTHDWHYRMTYLQHATQTNHINNYGSAGARTSLFTSNPRNPGHQVNAANSAHGHQIYTAGNIIDKGFFTDPNADNRALWAEYNGGFQDVGLLPNSQFTSSQYPLLGAPLPIKSARDAYNDVIKDVGANAYLKADGSVGYYTDIQDTFYLDIMNQGEGAFHPYEMYDRVRSWFSDPMYLNFVSGISSTPINTRPAGYDTDGDGMPNAWEIIYGTNPDVADGNLDKDGDRYTNLEEFLNSVDKK